MHYITVLSVYSVLIYSIYRFVRGFMGYEQGRPIKFSDNIDLFYIRK